MEKSYLLILCGLLISGSTFAYCPKGQNVEKTVECITIEGSGANYQDWSKEMYGEPEKDNSMVSKITGEDIRKSLPAAGTKK